MSDNQHTLELETTLQKLQKRDNQFPSQLIELNSTRKVEQESFQHIESENEKLKQSNKKIMKILSRI
jgi:hypothetical protein